MQPYFHHGFNDESKIIIDDENENTDESEIESESSIEIEEENYSWEEACKEYYQLSSKSLKRKKKFFEIEDFFKKIKYCFCFISLILLIISIIIGDNVGVFLLVIAGFFALPAIISLLKVFQEINIGYNTPNRQYNSNSQKKAIREYDLKSQFKLYDLIRYMPRFINVIITNLDKVPEDDRERKLEDMKNKISKYFQRRRIKVNGFNLVFFDATNAEWIEHNNNTMKMIFNLVKVKDFVADKNSKK